MCVRPDKSGLSFVRSKCVSITPRAVLDRSKIEDESQGPSMIVSWATRLTVRLVEQFGKSLTKAQSKPDTNLTTRGAIGKMNRRACPSS